MKRIADIIAESQGNVTYDEISCLDLTLGVAAQIASLKEDLLQVEYPDNILLDVGWFPSFDIDGHFKVQVIKEGDWENPLWQKDANDYETLIGVLGGAFAFTEVISR